jgi:3-oxoacyl-[acyl-carrier protein] reductase
MSDKFSQNEPPASIFPPVSGGNIRGEKIALITGSSRGIGRGIALALARDGFDIVINYLKNRENAETLHSEITKLGQRSLIVQADVTKSDQVATLIQSIMKEFGNLSILVNNVGPFRMKSLYNSDEQDWQEMIQGNLTSAFLCTRAALPYIRKAKGSVIFIGAPNAEQLRAAPNTSAYTIAKNGVVALAKTLAREEAKFGVRVNVVNPGIINTGMTKAEIKEQSAYVPLGRVGSVEDIAEAVSFLVSERASYITGAVLNVSGGLWV